MSDVYRKLSRDFLPTLKNAVLFWPLVSVVNSVFVPVLSRPAFSSFMGVFWNVYISYQANHNGMEVGELSVVYPRSQEQAQEEEEVALAKTVVVAEKAVAEKAAEKTTAVAAVASDAKGAAGVAANSVTAPAVAVADEGKTDATPESEGGPATAATPPSRKRRGRIVRRTSVVSM